MSLLDAQQHHHTYVAPGEFPGTPAEYVGHGYQKAITDVLTIFRDRGIVKDFKIMSRTVELAELEPEFVEQVQEARDALTKALRKAPRL